MKKGETGELVVYANSVTRTETDEKGEETERKIPFLKGCTVFNAEPCAGLPPTTTRRPSSLRRRHSGAAHRDVRPVLPRQASISATVEPALSVPKGPPICRRRLSRPFVRPRPGPSPMTTTALSVPTPRRPRSIKDGGRLRAIRAVSSPIAEGAAVQLSPPPRSAPRTGVGRGRFNRAAELAARASPINLRRAKRRFCSWAPPLTRRAACRRTRILPADAPSRSRSSRRRSPRRDRLRPPGTTPPRRLRDAEVATTANSAP